MAHDHREHANADKLYELVDDIKVCMMTTQQSDGSLHSRPMYSHDADDAGDLWFFTSASEPKIAEIAKDSQINLAFGHPGKQHYVSISGRAELVRDRKEIDARWSEYLTTWFPKGRNDPDIALIRVHPEKGEYWDSPSSTVVHLYGYVKAKLTGESPTELGEQAKVDLT